MPNLTPKNLYIGNTTGSNIYTSGSNVGDYSIIKLINICNSNTSASKSFTIHLLTTTNNTAQSNNIIISNLSIPPNNVMQIDTSLVINSNSSIYLSHTGNITVTISGVEYK